MLAGPQPTVTASGPPDQLLTKTEYQARPTKHHVPMDAAFKKECKQYQQKQKQTGTWRLASQTSGPLGVKELNQITQRQSGHLQILHTIH